MAYINGNSVRLTVLDNGTPVAVLYEQESTLNVNLNAVDLPHKDAMQWMVKQPFGLKDWSIDCTRFYSDDNDNAPLNFNDAVELLISGDQIQVEYNLGDSLVTIYEGFARVNSDTLNANQSDALIATVNLMGDGFLQKKPNDLDLFTMVIDTDLGNGLPLFSLPLLSNGNYNFTVDWGDGSSDVITQWNQPEVTHTYSVSGEYEVNIRGVMSLFAFNFSGDREKLIQVTKLGDHDFDADFGVSTFSGCSNLLSFEADNINTSSVTSMFGMFISCSSLTSLDLSSFDTSSVTDITEMFRSCSSLTSLDLSSFNTSSVTSMLETFRFCSSLISLDLSSFDTSSVTSMLETFSGCSSLTSLDLSSFNTSSVTSMDSMFRSCSSLTSLDLSLFDTSSVTSMQEMFRSCSSLTSLDLSSFDTSSVTNMIEMFRLCSSLTSLDLSSFDTSSVTNMSSMFSGCPIDVQSYSSFLIAINSSPTNQNGVTLDAPLAQYNTTGGVARTNIINTYSWTINDAGPE